jgi:hypothetical protein
MAQKGGILLLLRTYVRGNMTDVLCRSFDRSQRKLV